MINRKARIFRASFSIFVRLYDKCMTKQNENRVADIYNAVSVRSEAFHIVETKRLTQIIEHLRIIAVTAMCVKEICCRIRLQTVANRCNKMSGR